MSDTPTWYDLLDVPRDASADEVRAAWKSQIADLEPGDRRFDALNRAAKVLLDPAARAAYDASLPAEGDEDPDPAAGPRPSSAAGEAGGVGAPVLTDVEAEREKTRLVRQHSKEQARERRERELEQRVATGSARGVPAWLLAGLGIMAAALLVATVLVWNAGGDGGGDSAARDAQVAAERAVVPVLSYDYQHLDADQKAATALMTGGYKDEYDKLFAVLQENAPQTQTTVTTDVIASGIVRASDERVQVLVFVDRPTTNKLSAEPVVYKDQVTMSMQLVDGVWLVDDLITSPVQG